MHAERTHTRTSPSLWTTALCCAAAVAGTVTAVPTYGAIQTGDLTLDLETVAQGLVSPLHLTHAGDGSGRLFVVDQAGYVWIIEDGALLGTPFLDVRSDMVTLGPGYDERGLLGMAFHPDYANNGRFFVRYSRARAGSPGEPCFGSSRGCHAEVLVEHMVTDDPNVADPNGTIIYSADQPESNHNAGAVAFGPDGYLYFTLGDGGGANDGLANNPPLHGPIGNGQNINTDLGSMLRIDVDSEPQTPLAYAIPPDNPFVGVDGLDEIYAYGFRNPFSFSFDDGPRGDGRLFVADVGQNLYEELNIVERGGNYGWARREGQHCFDPLSPGTPPADCDTDGLIDPIVEYHQDDGGISIMGGYVYRGAASPCLDGTYIFGDFSADFGLTGRLYYLVEPTTGAYEIRRARLGANDRPLLRYVKGFGEGEDGDLYVLVSRSATPSGSTGEVLRISADIEPPIGDGDSDCDVDFDDHAGLVACFSGPDQSFDVDGVATVDVAVGPGVLFSPADVMLEVGDTAHWYWSGGFHNVESGVDGIHDGNFRSGDPTSDTATTFDVTFDQAFLTAHPMPGLVYPYYCTPHVSLGMTGNISVVSDPCAVFDYDNDGDVDLADWSLLQTSYTGS